jgi:hypothetical protein
MATSTISEGKPRKAGLVNSSDVRRWRTSKGVMGLARATSSSSSAKTLESQRDIFHGITAKLMRG